MPVLGWTVDSARVHGYGELWQSQRCVCLRHHSRPLLGELKLAVCHVVHCMIRLPSSLCERQALVSSSRSGGGAWLKE